QESPQLRGELSKRFRALQQFEKEIAQLRTGLLAHKFLSDQVEGYVVEESSDAETPPGIASSEVRINLRKSPQSFQQKAPHRRQQLRRITVGKHRIGVDGNALYLQ